MCPRSQGRNRQVLHFEVALSVHHLCHGRGKEIFGGGRRHGVFWGLVLLALSFGFRNWARFLVDWSQVTQSLSNISGAPGLHHFVSLLHWLLLGVLVGIIQCRVVGFQRLFQRVVGL